MDIQLEKKKWNPEETSSLYWGRSRYSSAVGLDYFRQSRFYIETSTVSH